MGFKLNKLCEKAKVKGIEKQVLSKLFDHASEKNNYSCWPSNKVLAREIGRSVRSIQRSTKTLKEKIDSVVNKGDNPIIFRDRHIKITKKILECLNSIQVKDIENSPELVAEDIRHSLTLIGKITGSVGVEEVLDNLFKNFCIGK